MATGLQTSDRARILGAGGSEDHLSWVILAGLWNRLGLCQYLQITDNHQARDFYHHRIRP
jgi:hypothetical protein